MPRFVPVEELFKGRTLTGRSSFIVRWYLSYKLSYRDLVTITSERGIGLAHTTILRWVQHYTPEFEKRRSGHARPVGGSWRCDETYIQVKGAWMYLYRAVDQAGMTVDFNLSRNRDVAAAKAYLRTAMRPSRTPTKITLDAYTAPVCTRAVGGYYEIAIGTRMAADWKAGERTKEIANNGDSYEYSDSDERF